MSTSTFSLFGAEPASRAVIGDSAMALSVTVKSAVFSSRVPAGAGCEAVGAGDAGTGEEDPGDVGAGDVRAEGEGVDERGVDAGGGEAGAGDGDEVVDLVGVVAASRSAEAQAWWARVGAAAA